MTKISNQYSLTNILTADLANSRLGINNVSPTVALDVVGITKVSSSIYASRALFDSDFLQNETSKVGISFASGYGQINSWGANTSTYGGLKFQLSVSNGATVTPLTIVPTGQVGIGKTPRTTGGITLDVAGGIQTTNDSGNVSYINFGQYSDPSLSYTYMQGDGRSTGFLRFHTNDSERMRILANGNVGIGTSSPTNLLQVNGTGYFSGNLSSGGTISGSNVSASGTTSGSSIVANSAIITYNVQQYYYGNTFTFTPPNALNSGSFNSEMRIYLVWVIGVNGYTEAGLRVWLIAMNGGGTAYNANELLGRDANGGTGLNIYRSSASQISINSNNNAFIKFVSIMQLNAF